jgi:hypothetical protein
LLFRTFGFVGAFCFDATRCLSFPSKAGLGGLGAWLTATSSPVHIHKGAASAGEAAECILFLLIQRGHIHRKKNKKKKRKKEKNCCKIWSGLI